MQQALTAPVKEITSMASQAGATHVRIITTEHLLAKEDVRQSCAMNACGKYGRCWMCPPMIGNIDQLSATMQHYSAGVLIQNISRLADSWDFEGMMEASHRHNDMLRQLVHRIKHDLPACSVLPLGSGGCGYCEQCACPDAPCRCPKEAISSVEGYGLDVTALVESCGLNYMNGLNTVSYVGILLIR